MQKCIPGIFRAQHVVDLSNLQRQVIHTTADIGKPKVISAKETMNAINPDVKVITYQDYINSTNILDIIKDFDFVLDGTDNFPTKFLINDACVMAKIPFSYAGIIRFKGQLMTVIPGESPCYRCVFKNPPPKDAVPTCKQADVIGASALCDLVRHFSLIGGYFIRRKNMAEYTVDETVDITDVVCPVTFVKAKAALEEMEEGQILAVHMKDGEPVQNVPRSIKDEGHKILKLIDNQDGTYNLIVKKVGE